MVGDATPSSSSVIRRRILCAKLTRHLEQLPVLPTVVGRLMSLAPDAEDYFEQVRSLIESEPSFSTRLLAVANCATSSPRAPTATIEDALARVGSRCAASLLLSIAVTRVFIPRDPWEKSLWRHALQVGILARTLARFHQDSDAPPEEAYLCGLLHDIGRFLMFQQDSAQLRQVDEADWGSPEELLAAELGICGWTHSELGAWACEHWRLPGSIVYVVGEHHNPLRTEPTNKEEKLTALIQAADRLMFPSAMPGAASLDTADDATLQAILDLKLPGLFGEELSVPELRSLVATAVEEAEAQCRGLGVA